MTLFRRLVLLVAALTCLPATALAAEVKTFAVAPFTVHGPEKYQYLSQGVQSMLESRMNWPGQGRSAWCTSGIRPARAMSATSSTWQN